MHQLLFQLFDDKSKGRLVQSHFVDFLNEKLGYNFTMFFKKKQQMGLD